MSNPFMVPGSPISQVHRRQRERFRLGVYAGLSTSTVLLLALLIQGCNRQQPPGAVATEQGYEVSTNSASATAEPVADTNTPPQTNVVAQIPVAQTNVPAETLATPAPVVAAPVVETPVEAPAPAPVQTTTKYVVKKGDTLNRIAKAHKTTVKAIKAENGLKTDRINVGKELKITQVASGK